MTFKNISLVAMLSMVLIMLFSVASFAVEETNTATPSDNTRTDTLHFENIDITIPVTKVCKNMPDDATFEFKLKPVTENAPMPSGSSAEATITTDKEGTVEFPTITYTERGQYEYEVSEENLGKEGFTYDDTVYEVVVQIGNEGVYTVTVINKNDEVTKPDNIIFNNEYKKPAAKAGTASNSNGSNWFERNGFQTGDYVFMLIGLLGFIVALIVMIGYRIRSKGLK